MKTVSLPSPHPPTLLDHARLNLERENKEKRERRNMLDEGLERKRVWDLELFSLLNLGFLLLPLIDQSVLS